MDKSPEAFRTISEVASLLDTPAHVLRFWESRFPQIRPVKRAGGRRYYRPNDVALLSGIKHLLHAEGMTIRGVQKMLRDQGVRHVASLAGAEITDIDLDAEAALAAALSANFAAETGADTDAVESSLAEDSGDEAAPARAEGATVVALESALRRMDAARTPPPPAAAATGDDPPESEPESPAPDQPAPDMTPAQNALPDVAVAAADVPKAELAEATLADAAPPEQPAALPPLVLDKTNIIDRIDFTRPRPPEIQPNLPMQLDAESPMLPGLEVALPASPPITTLPQLIAALQTLPPHALAHAPQAHSALQRARDLHRSQAQNAQQAAL